MVVAECVHVLESVYRVEPAQVVLLMRSLLASPFVLVEDPTVLDRSLELYELVEVGFTDAYLLARAELSGIRRIASFDRKLNARAEMLDVRALLNGE